MRTNFADVRTSNLNPRNLH